MVEDAGRRERFFANLKRNLKIGLGAGGTIVMERMQLYSPEFTSTMARSVEVSAVFERGTSFVVYVGPGPEAPYARFTEEDEYLTTKSGKRKKLGPISVAKGTAKMPWMRPGARDSLPELREIYRAAVVDAARRT